MGLGAGKPNDQVLGGAFLGKTGPHWAPAVTMLSVPMEGPVISGSADDGPMWGLRPEPYWCRFLHDPAAGTEPPLGPSFLLQEEKGMAGGQMELRHRASFSKWAKEPAQLRRWQRESTWGTGLPRVNCSWLQVFGFLAVGSVSGRRTTAFCPAEVLLQHGQQLVVWHFLSESNESCVELSDFWNSACFLNLNVDVHFLCNWDLLCPLFLSPLFWIQRFLHSHFFLPIEFMKRLYFMLLGFLLFPSTALAQWGEHKSCSNSVIYSCSSCQADASSLSLDRKVGSPLTFGLYQCCCEMPIVPLTISLIKKI